MALFSLKGLAEFMQERREAKRLKEMAKCSHYEVHVEGGRVVVVNLIESPFGTFDWICNRCGLVTTEMGADRVSLHAERAVREVARKHGIKLDS
jgi:hypothetical protein